VCCITDGRESQVRAVVLSILTINIYSFISNKQMNTFHHIPVIQLSLLAALYGEQLILLQYLPHMGELITLCKRKLTAKLEGGLEGCLALHKYIIPYLCDATLMD
jgi:WD repeat-containing protein 81